MIISGNKIWARGLRWLLGSAHRPLLMAAVAVSLPLLIGLGCDGGDGELSATPATSPAAKGSPTAAPDATAGSPEPAASPTASPQVPRAPQPTVTPPPGTGHAVIPENVTLFLGQFRDVTLVREKCDYEQETGLADCGADLGQFALDPPMTGSGITCEAFVVEGQARALSCTSEEPYYGASYEILR